jgi:hypothetical protein
MSATDAISTALNVPAYGTHCSRDMLACAAGAGLALLVLLVVMLVYLFLFAKAPERMANLASVYDANPDALRLARSITASDPPVSGLRRERMAENTSDRMAAYLWS